MTRELGIIVPTYNERENVAVLLGSLEKALEGVEWEVIFVDDDSPDGTAEAVAELAASRDYVRCIKRIGRRGLSSACIEGMLASNAKYLAVMDSDLQHDESLLPRMLSVLKEEDLDIVIGSRYVEGGGVGEWDAKRFFFSRLATKVGNLIVRADVKDPMSGFFMLNRIFLIRSRNDCPAGDLRFC